MSLSDNQLALTKVYLAAFNRAPEKSGLDYWVNEMDSGKSFADVVSTIFSLDVTKEIYPTPLSDGDFVARVYANVFGKVADTEGFAYWFGKLGSGQDRTSLVIDMVDAGVGTADGTPGKSYVLGRYTVANHAAQQQEDAGGDIGVESLKTIMAGVNGDPLTVINANATIDSVQIINAASTSGAHTPVNAALPAEAVTLVGVHDAAHVEFGS